jgi:hypothetical protein
MVKHHIYVGYPTKNRNRILYVGRTCQNFDKYVEKRHRDCFVSNPSCSRKLYSFMRKHYKQTNVSENLRWEIIEDVVTDNELFVKRREQYWINRLSPELNSRNEII